MMSALIAGLVALATSVIASLITLQIAKDRAKVDISLAEQNLRQEYAVEFAAERVARALMSDAQWRWRSFKIIQHHLGGFADDELRRLLVRAGAIRTIDKQGAEVWGLLDRNQNFIGMEAVEVGATTRETAHGRQQQQQD